MSWKASFSHFLDADPGRLHAAAHSHHPWPDAGLEAQQRAWLDAAELQDGKWARVLGEVLPEARGHVARRLQLSDPSTVCFAPSTHDLLMRLISCLATPARVLTTDAEFHSFARQCRRLEEAGLVVADRVAAEPFLDFPERFAKAAGNGGHDLVFFSQVHFNSGYVTPDLAALVDSVPSPETLVVIDGYHGFMALPTDLALLEGRAFYLAGGYKYAMAGEGACFLHCPPGYAARPVDTGWCAEFGDLAAPPGPGLVGYPTDGSRFLGATFDPTGIYRFNAAQRFVDKVGLDVASIHDHVARLQRIFLDRLDDLGIPELGRATLVPPDGTERGNFLTFRSDGAGDLFEHLLRRGVVTDYRGDRLRIGFGIYHDETDIEELSRRLLEVARA